MVVHHHSRVYSSLQRAQDRNRSHRPFAPSMNRNPLPSAQASSNDPHHWPRNCSRDLKPSLSLRRDVSQTPISRKVGMQQAAERSFVPKENMFRCECGIWAKKAVSKRNCIYFACAKPYGAEDRCSFYCTLEKAKEAKAAALRKLPPGPSLGPEGDPRGGPTDLDDHRSRIPPPRHTNKLGPYETQAGPSNRNKTKKRAGQAPSMHVPTPMYPRAKFDAISISSTSSISSLSSMDEDPSDLDIAESPRFSSPPFEKSFTVTNKRRATAGAESVPIKRQKSAMKSPTGTYRFEVGAHVGETISEVAKYKPKYINYMRGQLKAGQLTNFPGFTRGLYEYEKAQGLLSSGMARSSRSRRAAATIHPPPSVAETQYHRRPSPAPSVSGYDQDGYYFPPEEMHTLSLSRSPSPAPSLDSIVSSDSQLLDFWTPPNLDNSADNDGSGGFEEPASPATSWVPTVPNTPSVAAGPKASVAPDPVTSSEAMPVLGKISVSLSENSQNSEIRNTSAAAGNSRTAFSGTTLEDPGQLEVPTTTVALKIAKPVSIAIAPSALGNLELPNFSSTAKNSENPSRAARAKSPKKLPAPHSSMTLAAPGTAPIAIPSGASRERSAPPRLSIHANVPNSKLFSVSKKLNAKSSTEAEAMSAVSSRAEGPLSPSGSSDETSASPENSLPQTVPKSRPRSPSEELGVESFNEVETTDVESSRSAAIPSERSFTTKQGASQDAELPSTHTSSINATPVPPSPNLSRLATSSREQSDCPNPLPKGKEPAIEKDLAEEPSSLLSRVEEMYYEDITSEEECTVASSQFSFINMAQSMQDCCSKQNCDLSPEQESILENWVEQHSRDLADFIEKAKLAHHNVFLLCNDNYTLLAQEGKLNLELQQAKAKLQYYQHGMLNLPKNV